jgi:hypothetical protein
MARLIRFLRTRGLQRGVYGSSRGWLGVWVAIALGQFLQKRLGRESQVVERVVLRPGQAVQVRDTAVLWKDDPEATADTGGRRRGRRSGQAR